MCVYTHTHSIFICEEYAAAAAALAAAANVYTPTHEPHFPTPKQYEPRYTNDVSKSVWQWNENRTHTHVTWEHFHSSFQAIINIKQYINAQFYIWHLTWQTWHEHTLTLTFTYTKHIKNLLHQKRKEIEYDDERFEPLITAGQIKQITGGNFIGKNNCLCNLYHCPINRSLINRQYQYLHIWLFFYRENRIKTIKS